jgi:hypothetical protein
MGTEKFIKDFKAYFVEWELNPFDEKKLIKIFEDNCGIQREVVVKKEVETIVKYKDKIRLIYIDRNTGDRVVEHNPEFTDARNDYVSSIINEVCELFGVTESELKSKKRTRHLCIARQFCYSKLRGILMSLTEIGDMFNRDHTSVMWSLQNLETTINANDYYSALWDAFFHKPVTKPDKMVSY